jgi:hypothetical protein
LFSFIVISILFTYKFSSPTFAIAVCLKPEISKVFVDSIVNQESSFWPLITIGHSNFDASILSKVQSKSYSKSLVQSLYSILLQLKLTGCTTTFVVV